jgi:hypothetical protein
MRVFLSFIFLFCLPKWKFRNLLVVKILWWRVRTSWAGVQPDLEMAFFYKNLFFYFRRQDEDWRMQRACWLCHPVHCQPAPIRRYRDIEITYDDTYHHVGHIHILYCIWSLVIGVQSQVLWKQFIMRSDLAQKNCDDCRLLFAVFIRGSSGSSPLVPLTFLEHSNWFYRSCNQNWTRKKINTELIF